MSLEEITGLIIGGLFFVLLIIWLLINDYKHGKIKEKEENERRKKITAKKDFLNFFNLKNYSAAINCIEQYYLYGDFFDNEKVAYCYCMAGKYKEAIDIYNRLLQTKPNNTEYIFNLALAKYKLNPTDSKYLEELYNKEKPFVILKEKMNLIFNDDEQQEANEIKIIKEGTEDKYKKKIFDKIFKTEFGTYEEYKIIKKYTVIEKETDLKQYEEERIKKYDKEIENNPKYISAYYFRGLAKHTLKQPEEAIKDYNKAIELDPKNSDAYYNRGNAKQMLKQHEQAIKDYDKAIELDPKNSDAYNDMTYSYLYTNQPGKALESIKKALELKPNRTWYSDTLGDVYKYIKDYDKAIEQYKKAISINKFLLDSYWNLFELYKTLGKEKGMIEIGEKLDKIVNI